MRKRTIIAAILVLTMAITLAAACKPKTYTDGTYQAVSSADDTGYAWAKVVIEGDKIKSVELKEFTGAGLEKDFATYPWPQSKTANEQMPAKFVAKNDWNVDVVAEATGSSNKYKEAVKFALEKGKREATTKTTYFNGTFMAKSDGDDNGWGVAWVTIANDQITAVVVDDIVVAEDGSAAAKDWATYAYPAAGEARNTMQERFVAAGPAGAANVDVVATVTGSSTKWVQAVTRALAAAKVK